MLEAKQHRKEDAGQEQSRIVARKDHGQHKDAVHEAIVLKMDVIDDQQTR